MVHVEGIFSPTAALVSWADRAWVSRLSTEDPDLEEDAAPVHAAKHFPVFIFTGSTQQILVDQWLDAFDVWAGSTETASI